MGSYSIKGSTLKIIAALTMIVDHIGACIIQRMLINNGVIAIAASGIKSILTLEGDIRELAILWWVMRMIIGRIAFPIYCFLLVEGFMHTRSVVKYSLRLLGFAIISEVPFDLAIGGQAVDLIHQNVFFTLLISLISMWGISYADKKMNGNIIAKIFVAFAGMIFAGVLNTDYGASGVAFVLLLYIFKYDRFMQKVTGAVASVLLLEEWAAPLSFAFIGGYKGEKGLNLKYFFYMIYPLHLIILYGVCIMLGLE